jgi:hypothetical protein
MNTALTALSDIESAWDPESLRDDPADISVLRYAINGRTRVVYGRPRRFSAPPKKTIHTGKINITCDFERADLLHYEDTENSVVLGIGASTVGGFPTPWITPVTSSPTTVPAVNTFNVFGTQPTWAMIDFTGTQTNPWIQVSPWRAELVLSFPVGQTITMDPRPWVQAVYYGTGAHVGGLLTSQTRMTKMLLTPGAHTASYGVAASDGPVSALLRWRNAYKSL